MCVCVYPNLLPSQTPVSQFAGWERDNTAGCHGDVLGSPVQKSTGVLGRCGEGLGEISLGREASRGVVFVPGAPECYQLSSLFGR